jgi:hypothetical protein
VEWIPTDGRVRGQSTAEFDGRPSAAERVPRNSLYGRRRTTSKEISDRARRADALLSQ